MEALFYAIIMVQILRYLNRVHNGTEVEFIHKKTPCISKSLMQGTVNLIHIAGSA